ncbi:MAG TPA: hypothetical protein VK675_03710 [Candidatus Paceibacterota bacterium]|nr:hypothetical protein [Candidatus Paceibacterota bacterium]
MKLFGSYWVLTKLPIWATAILLYIVTIGAIFILRDCCEGLFYNTSYSAMLGDGALMVVVLMAAEILKRRALTPESGWFHIVASALGVILGVVWWALDLPEQWGDRYHHLVIAPLLCYLFITLLPVIYKNGTEAEIIATLALTVVWALLCVYDVKTDRLNQRQYHGLGLAVDHIKVSKNVQRFGSDLNTKENF